MIFVSAEDFYEKAASCKVLTREEEIRCAQAMQAGDAAAREKLIQSYLPMVAGRFRRADPGTQTLGLALYFCSYLERAVDSFDFLQDSEPFSHRLSWYLRQAHASYLVR